MVARPAAVLAVLALAGCQPPPPKTIDGPEASDLAARVGGRLVTPERDSSNILSAVAVTEIPAGTPRVFQAGPADRAKGAVIHAVTGPDASGRVAFVQTSAILPGFAVLKVLSVSDGAETKV